VADVSDLDLMASITALMNTQGLDKMMGPNVGAGVKKELALAVRDNLVIIETWHKKKEIRRAQQSKSRAVKGTWTTRTGQLRRSFHRDWKQGKLYGAYGSDLGRAKKIEEGGTIRARGTFLAIPTSAAPVDVWPRYIPGLVYIQSLRGQPLLVKPKGGKSAGFTVMFVLRRQVTLPPRPALARSVKKTVSKRDARLFKGIEKAVLGKNNAK
jgi:hypothetical protein